mmetsp:Transcript_79196/g.240265  ORF Transcript_79196/g.240265 Transcript_79196/m.240265 type:complete len:231 (+) Transcript_79196:94-786(+)
MLPSVGSWLAPAPLHPKATAEDAPATRSREAEPAAEAAALRLKVFGMSGSELCEVSASAEDTILDLKAAIEVAAQVPAHEQRLMARQGWELSVLQNAAVLKDSGLGGGTELVMVRQQPFNGKYSVKIKWNGAVELQILGTHAKVMCEKGFEAEVEWDAADPRRATFSGRRMVTTQWAQRHTRGMHQEGEGVLETFRVEFLGDEAAAGFTGSFQREFEGPLPMSGTFVEEA